jgi:hypothetical protein
VNTLGIWGNATVSGIESLRLQRKHCEECVCEYFKTCNVILQGELIFQKSVSHLQILDARKVIRNNFHTEGPHILRATIQNVVATATWRLGFVHRCDIFQIKAMWPADRLRGTQFSWVLSNSKHVTEQVRNINLLV